MKVFRSKFICNNLYLLFVIFIIYLQSSKNNSTVFNWDLILNDWLIYKVNNRGNFCGEMSLVDVYDLSNILFFFFSQ